MKTQRVRRSRTDARAEILAAAESALAGMDFSALTVDEVMSRTGMTRSAFYHYFTGLDELVLALLERFEQDIRGSVDPWLRGETRDEDPREATITHLTAMFEVLHAHRTSYSAVVQAAGGNQRVYQEWQRRILDYFFDLTETFIRRQVELGRSGATDPRAMATALILMNNAVINHGMLREPDRDPAEAARTVAGIWNDSIYSIASLRDA